MNNKEVYNWIKKWISGVNEWVKHFNKRLNNAEKDLAEFGTLINENVDNIQHNYELIYEIKDDIEDLKQEINALKLIQIITLKQKMDEKEKLTAYNDESLAK